MDCGPSCIAMVASYYNKKLSLSYLRNESQLTREGVSLLSIEHTCNKIGLETRCGQFSISYLIEVFKKPCILHWNENHFVVLKEIKRLKNGDFIFIIYDPAFGKIKLTQEKFELSWKGYEINGFGIFISPSDLFFSIENQNIQGLKIKKILNFIKPQKKKFFIVMLLMLIGNILTLVFPFLTKILIDEGVGNKDFNYITSILLAQLLLYTSITLFEVFRNRYLLFIGTKIGINIITEFLTKLFTLPISFFESRMKGDLQQRINDNERIQQFLTNQSLTTIFSILTLVVYLFVLPFFGIKILVTYIVLTFISLIWSFYWLKKQKRIDYLMFQVSSRNYDSLSEILDGISEMKLNNFENFKQNNWKKVQDDFLEIRVLKMKIDQIQNFGYEFINQIKNILVVYIAANLVASGSMSLGSLLSVSFIVGQMSSPIGDIIEFIKSLQEANLSYSRLNEIQEYKSEEIEGQVDINDCNFDLSSGIHFNNVSFQYEGINSPKVLNNISFFIPNGKTTAIVGTSGSGKTTLIKLLLKYYKPTEGKIQYDNLDLEKISAKNLRANCGVVLQDGYIFSETLYRNIVLGYKHSKNNFLKSIQIANLNSFIDSLPLEENTMLGDSGIGVSGGQKQRILIARAVYKNAKYIYLDEATSSLDSENERIIHENLKSHFKNRTVVIVAHRLSTVKNADQIIVLEKGCIVEFGNHTDLINKKGEYYNLIKNQLELGD